MEMISGQLWFSMKPKLVLLICNTPDMYVTRLLEDALVKSFEERAI